MFSDIKTRLSTPKQEEPLEGITLAEILYADDIDFWRPHAFNTIYKLLDEIEVESSYYNMKPNYGKCINMTKYLDGTKVPPRDSRPV